MSTWKITYVGEGVVQLGAAGVFARHTTASVAEALAKPLQGDARWVVVPPGGAAPAPAPAPAPATATAPAKPEAKKDEPKADAKKDEPKADAKKDEPKKDAKKDESKKDEPKKDEPKKDEKSAAAPKA